MKKVFVTSHDQDWLFLIDRSLKQAGYEVHFVEQGEADKKETPDVYIIDTMSNEEISNCKYLNFHSTQVVITSADYTIRKKAMDSGADKFLKKPFTANTLISAIEKG
ncbi:MAG TPA: response regulator [Chryseosolibacter sp.]